MITLGIEQLLASPALWDKETRLGLLCNQASTDSRYRHSRDLINGAFPGQLTCLFTPQHGFYSEKQDNMIESGHTVDGPTGLPVFSLYGEVRQPTGEMFEHLDLLLVDLFDVGTRVYTFLYTMAYCLEAAVRFGKRVIVLDRPNPVGGELIEGNILQESCRSFVGLYPLPMRHGLTFGELALLLNQEYGINADLQVVKMAGWKRKMIYTETGLPFVFPSPNMPGPATALVYPGQVLWEGTNVSEGRGTSLPFELFGAPYLQQEKIEEHIKNTPLPGCYLRRLCFEPTSNKWQGEVCPGFHLHVIDPQAFRPYRTSLALLQAILTVHKEQFQYKEPPYEYEFEKLPMDLILGDPRIREALEAGEAVMDIEGSWQGELADFDQLRRQYFLYS